ncbi:hypothetical protein NHG33_06520 [Aerococcaceae bacterium NML130460]|nr:hypothetical protein [Aerococcaceae bacterium NML130460]
MHPINLRHAELLQQLSNLQPITPNLISTHYRLIADALAMNRSLVNEQRQALIATAKALNNNVEITQILQQMKLISESINKLDTSYIREITNQLNTLPKYSEIITKNLNRFSSQLEVPQNFVRNFSVDMTFEEFEHSAEKLVLEIGQNINQYPDINCKEQDGYSEQNLNLTEEIDSLISESHNGSSSFPFKDLALDKLRDFFISLLFKIIFYTFTGHLDFDLSKLVIQKLLEFINNLPLP